MDVERVLINILYSNEHLSKCPLSFTIIPIVKWQTCPWVLLLDLVHIERLIFFSSESLCNHTLDTIARIC